MPWLEFSLLEDFKGDAMSNSYGQAMATDAAKSRPYDYSPPLTTGEVQNAPSKSQQAYHALDGELERLSILASRLGDKLYPVLTPVPIEPAVEGTLKRDTPSLSQLSVSLFDMATRLSRINDEFDRMLNRIEL